MILLHVKPPPGNGYTSREAMRRVAQHLVADPSHNADFVISDGLPKVNDEGFFEVRVHDGTQLGRVITLLNHHYGLDVMVKSAAQVEELVPLPKPDFTALTSFITCQVGAMIETGLPRKDFEHTVYEAAMEAVYGKAYWEWRKKQKW